MGQETKPASGQASTVPSAVGATGIAVDPSTLTTTDALLSALAAGKVSLDYVTQRLAEERAAAIKAVHQPPKVTLHGVPGEGGYLDIRIPLHAPELSGPGKVYMLAATGLKRTDATLTPYGKVSISCQVMVPNPDFKK